MKPKGRLLWVAVIVAPLVTVSAVSIGLGYFVEQGLSGIGELNHEASAFADQSLVEICKDWDHQQAYELGSSTMKSFEPTQINSALDTLKKRYGSLIRIRSTQVTYLRWSSSHGVSECNATTSSKCDFEKGEGLVLLHIQKDGDDWEINGMAVTGGAASQPEERS